MPVVAAGGAKTPTLRDALTTAQLALICGARGVTIGRNIWSAPDPASAAAAFAGVIHEDEKPDRYLEGSF